MGGLTASVLAASTAGGPAQAVCVDAASCDLLTRKSSGEAVALTRLDECADGGRSESNRR